MSITLTIRDETTTGNTTYESVLEFMTQRISVAELIRTRVYQEVRAYNLNQPDYFKGLIQPTDTERTLNGFKIPRKRKINWQEQYDAAIEAFKGNQFFILVNDHQVDNLEDTFEINPDTQVSFLKLVPLVGG